MAQSNIDKIFNEYEQLRKKAALDREKRIQSIYSQYPRIKQINEEINFLGIKNTGDILKNPDKADYYINEFKKKLNELNTEKQKIITQNNIDTDFEEYKYKCEFCKDTGFIDNKKCKCFIQKQIDYEYESSNMSNLLRVQNFDTFKFDYYSKDIKDGEQISPYDNMQKNYRRIKEFCSDFKNRKSMLFYGESGLGKTFLSSCVAKELIDNGKTVLYTRATKLFSIYDDYKFNRDSSDVNREMIKRVYECDLLIIDDLGTEFQSKNTAAFLFDIINERCSNNKKMIISTNLTLPLLTEAYTYRFTSRLFEYFDLIKFIGDDIRVQLI